MFFLDASCACGTPKSHEPPPRPPSLLIAPLISQGPSINDSQSAMITSPISPTSPTIISASSLTNGSANRISKPQRPKRKGAGDGPGRRGSVIGGEAALELLLEKERERSGSAEAVKMEKAGSCCGVANISNGNGSLNGNTMHGFVPVFSAAIEGEDGNGFHLQQHQFPHLQNGSVPAGGSKPATHNGTVSKLDMGVDDILSLDTWNPDGAGSPIWQQAQPTPKKTGGCCGSKSSQSPQPQIQPQYMHHTPNPQSHSCCGAGGNGSAKSSPPVHQPVAVPIGPYTAPPFFSAPQYPQYLSTLNFPQIPTMWTYPTGYSTINHPLTPQELAWLQQQRAAGVFGHIPPVQPPPGHVVMSPMVNSVPADGWAHTCNCGSGCDCLGCATHPYNRRTMEYVQGIQQFMEGDNGYSNSHSHLHNHSRALSQQLPQTQPQQTGFGSNGQTSSPPPHSHPPASPTDLLSSNGNGTPAQVSSVPCCGKSGPHSQENQSNQNQQLSPPSEQDDETGADGTPGGTDNGGELSPSNFIYVDYPLGACAQTEAGCKCGEGCTCVGCLTHGGHDGIGLEGNVGENGDWW